MRFFRPLAIASAVIVAWVTFLGAAHAADPKLSGIAVPKWGYLRIVGQGTAIMDAIRTFEEESGWTLKSEVGEAIGDKLLRVTLRAETPAKEPVAFEVISNGEGPAVVRVQAGRESDAEEITTRLAQSLGLEILKSK